MQLHMHGTCMTLYCSAPLCASTVWAVRLAVPLLRLVKWDAQLAAYRHLLTEWNLSWRPRAQGRF